ncbi:hypothetical protein ASPZODRAFT_15757 [Penicilliopsis zonata CBS 506.65]|uniref:Uncharacterized protein n=1 Tax=Penicilliopsis zonata CBS 506.65 TaxID=1073090 RepID=A0A1L9SJ02_9EURO|nr:hypothetical protein ASPZODRAFT_15757 [Penicilliopsis zonata CBS 506.65]OJJ47073.1 hypothetical protein ASPZODRAFT_15757 [Penicilliopsis zonata CBS 506.65]
MAHGSLIYAHRSPSSPYRLPALLPRPDRPKRGPLSTMAAGSSNRPEPGNKSYFASQPSILEGDHSQATQLLAFPAFRRRLSGQSSAALEVFAGPAAGTFPINPWGRSGSSSCVQFFYPGLSQSFLFLVWYLDFGVRREKKILEAIRRVRIGFAGGVGDKKYLSPELSASSLIL